MAIFNKFIDQTLALDKEITVNIQKLCDLLHYDIVSIINFTQGYKIATSKKILLKKENTYISASEKWVKLLDNFPNHILNLLIKDKQILFFNSTDRKAKLYSPLIENINREIYIPILSPIKNAKDLVGCLYLSTFDINKLITPANLSETKINNILCILNKLCAVSYMHTQKNESTIDLINMMSEVTSQINPLTILHPYFVAQLSKTISQSLHLNSAMIEDIYLAGLLHDIGKISIDPNILTKRTCLTDEEFSALKNHSFYGSNMIKSIGNLNEIALFVKHHHEHYDGMGYPDGLSGDQIPLESRIIGTADAIDAMLSQRIYKPARSVDFVIKELIANSGKQFDPNLIDIAINILSNSQEDIFDMSNTPMIWSSLTLSTLKENYVIKGTLVKYNFGYLFKSNKFNFLSTIIPNQVFIAKLSIPKGYNQFIECEVTLDCFQENQVYISKFKDVFSQAVSVL